MRPLEIALSLAALLPVLLLLSPARPEGPWIFWSSLLALTIAVLQLIVERYRWQMFPAYFVVAILIVFECVQWSGPFRLPYIAGLAALCLLLGTVFMSTALPIFVLPAPTGSCKVGTQVRHLVDESRGDPLSSNPHAARELMIQIWYPADSAANGPVAYYRDRSTTTFRNSRYALVKTHSMLGLPLSSARASFPVLLFTPAWTGQRWEATSQAEELASHGYVVVGMDHPYISTITVFPDGRIARTTQTANENYSSQEKFEEFVAAAESQVKVRAADARFVLDTLAKLNQDDPGNLFTNRLDLNRVGIWGFSVGGAAAAQTCWLDPRFRAAVNLDGMAVDESGKEGASCPMLFLMAPDPFSEVGDFSKLSPSDRRQAEFGAAQTASMKHSLSEYGGYWVELPGTAHNDFSDIPLYSPFRFLTHAGPGDPVRTSRIIRRYMLAFFDQFLKGIEHPLLRGPSPEYPQLRFQAWTPKVRNAHVAAPANQKQ